MKRELFTAIALTGAIAFASKETQRTDVVLTADSCKSVIIDTPLARDGLTLPLTLHGDSIIFVNPNASAQLRRHELAHADQICEEGALPFLKNYTTDPIGYELDADRRAKTGIYIRSTSLWNASQAGNK